MSATFGSVFHGNRVGFDCNATLALEVHGIEELLLGLALLDRSRYLQKAVGESRFTVVDVGDDAKVARVFYSHEKPGTIGHSERRVNLKLLLRRKMKNVFDSPDGKPLSYFVEACQKPIPLRDPRSPCRNSE
jgi:hypothetical protein